MPRIANEVFYKNAIKKYGLTPQGVCWRSYAHQHIRFEILCELLPSNLQNYSLLDAGCGFGDLYSYLKNNHTLPKSYTGVDVVEMMCAIARKKTGAEILHADITQTEPPVHDYILCSGALNILTPYETTAFINNCYKSAKKGFVFNALCAEKGSQTYNYLSKEHIERLAKELNVAKLTLRENYMEGDISVGFFK